MAALSQVLIQSIRDVVIANVNEPRLTDADRIDDVAEQLYALVDQKNARKLVIDFSRTQQVAPALITVMLNLKRKSAAIKGEVVLCGTRPEVQKLFKIADLHKQFKFYADEEGGLRAFGMTTAG